MYMTGFTRNHRRCNAGRSAPPRLNLGMYNIRDGHGFGFPQVLRVVQLGNYELMLLPETKIPNTVYCKNRLVYNLV